MSAAEKLRALDEMLTVRPLRDPLDDIKATRSLRRALPQIVALVAAVESVTCLDPSTWHGSQRLLLALLSLDEALS